jgi:glycosyltransferase involved in cell wall biosynthesis
VLLSDTSVFTHHSLVHAVSYQNAFSGIHSDTIASVTASLLLNTCWHAPLVTFHSYVDPTMGYGSSAEQMALALHNSTNAPIIRFFPSLREKPPNWERAMDAKIVTMVNTPGVGRYYLGYFVPHEDDYRHIHWQARKAAYAIVYTTFEATGVPRTWPGLINRYDKLVVSCEEIAKAFAAGGVKIPIEIIPLGISVTQWPFLKRNWNILGSNHAPEALSEAEVSDSSRPKRPLIPTPFRFLMYADGSWNNHRKNYDLVFKAFMKAFPEHQYEKTVELWIKVTSEDRFIMHLNGTKPGNIQFVVGRLPQRKLLTALAQCHCLVFPSHGEGFGLPPREAMATGMPSIHAGFAGLSSVSFESVSIPVPYTLINASGYDAWIRENNNSTDFGQWADVSPSVLATRMLAAQRSVAEVERRGKAGAVYVRRYESYVHVGQDLVRVFGGLLGDVKECRIAPAWTQQTNVREGNELSG